MSKHPLSNNFLIQLNPGPTKKFLRQANDNIDLQNLENELLSDRNTQN